MSFSRRPFLVLSALSLSAAAQAQQALPTITVSARPVARAHAAAPARPPQTPSSALPVMRPVAASDTPKPPAMTSASEAFFTGKEVNALPFSRASEALEIVPGLIVTQHSGDGKANQYFMRGFNLDHGTDLALYLD